MSPALLNACHPKLTRVIPKLTRVTPKLTRVTPYPTPTWREGSVSEEEASTCSLSVTDKPDRHNTAGTLDLSNSSLHDPFRAARSVDQLIC